VHLVALNVTVLDQKGRAVPNLQKEDFKIYEDDIEQPISFFAPERVPVSWGLILDRSGSMEDMIGDVREAGFQAVAEMSPRDDMFVLLFNDRAELVSDLVTDRDLLGNSISHLEAEGGTALYDAAISALEHADHARNQRKVIVIVTDGQDENSRLRFDDLLDRVMQAHEISVYPVGLFASARRPWWDRSKFPTEIAVEQNLKRLAEISGTHAYFPKNREECRRAIQAIARDVRGQYSLSYYPVNRDWNGRWRTIRMEVFHHGKKDNALLTHTRAGYYAQ